MPITRKTSTKECVAKTNGKTECVLCGKSFVYNAGVFRRHVEENHNCSLQTYFDEHVSKSSKDSLCLCGCGQETNWTNAAGGRYADYVRGHNRNDFSIETIQKRNKSIKRSWDENRHAGGFRDEIVKRKASISRSITMKKQYAAGLLTLPNMKCPASKRTRAQQKAYQTRLKQGTEPNGWKNIKRGWYVSKKTNARVRYHSGWELLYMKSLDANKDVHWWERCNFFVCYLDPSTQTAKRYYPDFVVQSKHVGQEENTIIVEIKGQVTTRDMQKIKTMKELLTNKWNSRFVVLTLDKKTQTFYSVNL